ncbi:MAG TPA: M81 family metallopeptidase [Usitatibacter sp.]|jgi:microcystin degradation protein MlrC|nr:M81 family metallopeptidase [Usitatibacter sp.]
MAKGSPRIAVLGFSLESNGFAPVALKADFEESYLLAGDSLAADLRATHARAPGTLTGFHAAMEASGGWEMVPILVAATSPSGPVDQSFFDETLRGMRSRLAAALPLDGVYIAEHGAASATAEHDPDGALFAMVREIVGARVPVVATLDLHANVSDRMVRETDLLVSFLTNPHVDQRERGAEAANAMRELLGGTRTARAHVKLPLMPPSVTLLTGEAPGRPYGELIRLGQSKLSATIMNVSICAGFYLTDSPKAGMSVVVTARGDQEAANALARELADRAWNERHRYVPHLVPIAEAVRRMLEASRDPAKPAVCVADVADNPGGGGRGNTTDLLQALLAAGMRGMALGIFNDPALAGEAHRRGEGATFRATFNSAERHPLSKRFEADVEVVRLSDGKLIGRRGASHGRALDLGPSARMRIGGPGGVDVVVITIRQQCTDPTVLEHFGIDVGALRGLVVKSRGHFRAGFAEFFRDDQILEVDAPGLTTQGLAHLPYRNIPRPIFPLDPEASWIP